MRILVHDFAGHPFPIQLSRELATRGHAVLHLSAAGLPGPKGRLMRAASDPDGLEIRELPLSARFEKYSPVKRLVSQRQYSFDLVGVIHQFRPDAVLSGNTPIDVQARLLKHCRRNRIGFVHWVQDFYSAALDFILRPKLGSMTGLAVAPFRSLDRWVARNSDETVAISRAFVPLFEEWGVGSERLTVIENWAPIDEMPALPRRNAWSEARGINALPILLYSGTLGLKHRSDLIYIAAQDLVDQAQVVVVSEGIGRQQLENLPPLPNLALLDFQPYSELPQVLASADVLLATLESDAGEFAVPSKILNYLCAGRPVLLSAPLKNLAAEVVARSGGGIVVAPDDSAGWLRGARTLVSDEALRTRMGKTARNYAEATFEIGKITDRFESVLSSATARQSQLINSGKRLVFQQESRH